MSNDQCGGQAPGASGDKRRYQHRLGLRTFSQEEGVCSSDEGVPTDSSVAQRAVERNCLKYFGRQNGKWNEDHLDSGPCLNKEKTVQFLRNGLQHLPRKIESLDASRPWILYWILHSLELLDESVTDERQVEAIADFLGRCQNAEGGFGGGPGQLSHLATTYAAVNALCTLGKEVAYKVIDRENLAKWMNGLRLADGSFLMHQDGEVDIRGVYCALSVARLTNIFTQGLFKNTAQWILSCQSYEGGFGAAPGVESHGGYSFCGLAGLHLLNHGRLCDLDSLLRWATNKQMAVEGGFQGRTNKLVDSCYSFWQGGIFPLIHLLLAEEGQRPRDLLFDSGALQEYLLICCQDHRGGLLDKPGASRDYYHTCYSLSGLAIAQYPLGKTGDEEENIVHVIGPKTNKLKPTHPLYNIGMDAAISSSAYFDSLPVISA